MKYLKLYESFSDICWLYGIKNYTINSDGSVDVYGNVNLYEKKLWNIPLQFNKVNGWFNCANNKLTSLKGSPKEVYDKFDCNHNELTSLQYAPKIIRGKFDCCSNKIKTFEYFPSYVEDFSCNGNPIYEVWKLFWDWKKIELLNDFDIFRDEDTDKPAIVMDRLNDFLLEIGKDPVEKVYLYKNI